MSYTQSFNKQIAVHYSGTVSTSVSVSTKDGVVSKSVTVPYSGTVYENVEVNVNVNTDPFDDSIDQCNSTVSMLTGAVAASEAAQVSSIRKKANKVGQTIVNGFFKTVRSEISQQITELKIQIDSTLIHMNELAKRCLSKQKQMQSDYARICERYLKLFDSLNDELHNRIFELDRPTFNLYKLADDCTRRTIKSDAITTVVVSGAENGALEARLGASVAKRQASKALNSINNFLYQQKRIDKILEQNIRNEEGEQSFFAPVCYVETREQNIINKKVYCPEELPVNKDMIETYFATNDGHYVGIDKVKELFAVEVNARYAASNEHNNRVKEYMNKLLNKTIQ